MLQLSQHFLLAPQDSLLPANLFIPLCTSLLAPHIQCLLTLCMFINFIYILTETPKITANNSHLLLIFPYITLTIKIYPPATAPDPNNSYVSSHPNLQLLILHLSLDPVISKQSSLLQGLTVDKSMQSLEHWASYRRSHKRHWATPLQNTHNNLNSHSRPPTSR